MDNAKPSDKTFSKLDSDSLEHAALSSANKLRDEANLAHSQPAGKDNYKWDAEFLPNKIYGTEKWIPAKPDPILWSEKLENKAMNGLASCHKNLSFSKGHENVRVFPFKDQFTVEKDQTAMQLAEQQLGPRASQSQVKYFAELLMDLNNKEGDPSHTVFKAKSSIAVPGQPRMADSQS